MRCREFWVGGKGRIAKVKPYIQPCAELYTHEQTLVLFSTNTSFATRERRVWGEKLCSYPNRE
jgi:hypothetical protein